MALTAGKQSKGKAELGARPDRIDDEDGKRSKKIVVDEYEYELCKPTNESNDDEA